MQKKKASNETVNAFIKAVYPEMTELAMTMGSEESILKDATKKIAALEAAVKEKDRQIILLLKTQEQDDKETAYLHEQIAAREAAVKEKDDILLDIMKGRDKWRDVYNKSKNEAVSLKMDNEKKRLELIEQNDQIDTSEDRIAALEAVAKGTIPEDVWVVAVAKYEEQIAKLSTENKRLRERLYSHGDIQTDEEDALKQGKEAISEQD